VDTNADLLGAFDGVPSVVKTHAQVHADADRVIVRLKADRHDQLAK
jgi:hypothetical protein